MIGGTRLEAPLGKIRFANGAHSATLTDMRATFSTAFGVCSLAWNDAGLTSFGLPSPDVNPASELDVPLPAWVQQTIARVQAHFAGDFQDFSDVPLDWERVSEFQQGVYRHTQAVLPGHTTSYGEIARRMALGPEAARAVGVALGLNPWPLIVPCHRVVASNGKMTGFSGPGGVRTKTRLLVLEGAELLSE